MGLNTELDKRTTELEQVSHNLERESNVVKMCKRELSETKLENGHLKEKLEGLSDIHERSATAIRKNANALLQEKTLEAKVLNDDSSRLKSELRLARNDLQEKNEQIKKNYKIIREYETALKSTDKKITVFEDKIKRYQNNFALLDTIISPVITKLKGDQDLSDIITSTSINHTISTETATKGLD